MYKPVLTHPSYEQLHIGTLDIINKMLIRQSVPDWIIGLTRGGLVPAVIASHAMNLPMMPVNYSSVEGNGDNKNHQNNLPEIPDVGIVSGMGELPPLPALLIIDDICDSGRTMMEVATHYEDKGYPVLTASLYYKEGSLYQPNFTWQAIPEDSPWIVFPFER